MRICVIETKGAGPDLVRFTEVKALFDYENRWLGFFDRVVLCEHAGDHPGPAWRIRAGQYITYGLRQSGANSMEQDLRNNAHTIDFHEPFQLRRFMPRYRGLKQQYVLENYLVMILKQKQRMLYLSNNESPPSQSAGERAIWVPASGILAYNMWRASPRSALRIYDRNPQQLEFAQWHNARPRPPSGHTVMSWVSARNRVAVAEPWLELTHTTDWAQWLDAPKSYHLTDILAQDIPAMECVWTSNILKYMPCYAEWGSRHIWAWHQRNQAQILGDNTQSS